MTDNKKLINGKMRNVHKGKKGGKYYISKGKKVYFGAKRKRSPSGSGGGGSGGGGSGGDIIVGSGSRRRRKKPNTRRGIRRIARMASGPIPYMMIDAGLLGARSMWNAFPSGALTRAVGATSSRYFPNYTHRLATGINYGTPAEPTYNEPITGVAQRCALLPSPLREACETDFCRRNSSHSFCLNRNRQAAQAAAADAMAIAAAEESLQLQNLEMARDVFERQSGPNQVAILNQLLNQLPSDQRDNLVRLYNNSFGKKKAKQNTKKTSKQNTKKTSKQTRK